LFLIASATAPSTEPVLVSRIVWYRSSSNGGRSWSSPVKLDDAPADDGNPGYINASGFDEIYGDYGEIAVTSAGRTFATWGEGFSYTGPGGTWFNLQR